VICEAVYGDQHSYYEKAGNQGDCFHHSKNRVDDGLRQSSLRDAERDHHRVGDTNDNEP
jgi:hypothetical protein